MDSYAGNFAGEVDAFSDLDVVWSYNGAARDGTPEQIAQDKAAWTRRAMSRASTRNRLVLFGPNVAPSDRVVTPAAILSIDAAKPWNSIVVAGFLDELETDAAETFDMVNECRRLLGVPVPWIVSRTQAYMASGQTGWMATNAIPMLEVYGHPDNQNDPGVVAKVEAQTLRDIEKLGNREFGLISMSYRIEKNGIKWTNDETWEGLIRLAYDLKNRFKNCKWLLPFAWAQPGLQDGQPIERGTRGSHRMKALHQELYKA